jgi:hypothetical protein
VPFLDPPLKWRAYVTETYESEKRTFKDLALIQMDIMVRDDNSPQGWVFGTYQYNGAQGRENRWENLVPLGLQWGNDPDITEHRVNAEPIETICNPALKETVINKNDEELPPTHLGWNGRLNGPVDNPMSSCMSCHATAQVRQKSQMSPLFEADPPAPGSKKWMRWFQNYKCGERFDEDVPSADFSLQLAASVQNWQNWQGEARRWKTNNYKSLSEKKRQIEIESEEQSFAPVGGAPVTRELDN